MSDTRRIICGAHGDTPATYMCQHLVNGVACGFHASVDDPTDTWPDAWCDRCEGAFQAAGGEWNDDSEAGLGAKVQCTGCYERARSRNRDVPLLARGKTLQMTDKEQGALVHHAVHALQDAQNAADQRWGFLQMARWNHDPEARRLIFTDPEHPTVIADVRYVGSYSTKSSTFQWAWKTYEGHGSQAADSAPLRVFGEVRGIELLTTPNWACEEADAWEMTALAAYLLGAEGAYRPPIAHVRWFYLLSHFRHPS